METSLRIGFEQGPCGPTDGWRHGNLDVTLESWLAEKMTPEVFGETATGPKLLDSTLKISPS
ncbi:MAG TPA: hypothetical protein VJX16_12855 [Terriglobales bacterium]|nr:hypothetical protein [Terriglobales bacterium]